MTAVVVMTPEQLRELVREVFKEELANQPIAHRDAPKTTKRLLTVPKTCREYAIGRAALLDLVKSGKLKSTERKMRGGKIGLMLAVADLERVLGGSKP